MFYLPQMVQARQGRPAEKAKLVAAGNDAGLAANAQGAELTHILTAAAAASFRTAALIPLCLVVIFTAIAVADRLRKEK